MGDTDGPSPSPVTYYWWPVRLALVTLEPSPVTWRLTSDGSSTTGVVGSCRHDGSRIVLPLLSLFIDFNFGLLWWTRLVTCQFSVHVKYLCAWDHIASQTTGFIRRERYKWCSTDVDCGGIQIASAGFYIQVCTRRAAVNIDWLTGKCLYLCLV